MFNIKVFVKSLSLLFLVIFLTINLSHAMGLMAVDSAQNLVIDRVDNNSGIIVIGDVLYKLQLNTKVVRGNRVLNRYALKAGQQVKVKSVYKGSQRYLTFIMIDSQQ